jgi:CYTH domain-containing protein
MNAIWIAIELDYNDQPALLDAHWAFQLGEHLFCAYFSGEIIIRFFAFAQKLDAWRDMPFAFDAFLAFMMFLETWVLNLMLVLQRQGGDSRDFVLSGDASILRIVRLLKLMRMTRVMRLLRAVPELMILVKGLRSALRSVIFTLTLLLIFIYIFSLVITQIAEGSEMKETHFPSMLPTMVFLFLQGVLPDLVDLCYRIGEANLVLGIFFVFFILVCALIMLNMLIGILCEVVSATSAVEREQLTIQFVSSRIFEMMEKKGLLANFMAENGQVISKGDRKNLTMKEAKMSRVEYEALLLNHDAAKMVEEVGVDVVGLVYFTDFLFKGKETISLGEFTRMLLSLRGSNQASVKDIVDLRKYVVNELDEKFSIVFDDLRDHVEDILCRHQGLQAHLDKLMILASTNRDQTAMLTKLVKAAGNSSRDVCETPRPISPVGVNIAPLEEQQRTTALSVEATVPNRAKIRRSFTEPPMLTEIPMLE